MMGGVVQREKGGEQSCLFVFLQWLERDLLPYPLEGPSKFYCISRKVLARNKSSISGDHYPALSLC